MREIAIIGAGELAGTCAHVLARRDVARTITLIDEHGRVAAGKALDIAQAAPVEGFATQLRGETDFASAAAADVVVVADRFGAGEWRGEEALALFRRFSISARQSTVVCAGAAGRDAVDIAVRELKMPRRRWTGSAPEALAAAAKALVALALDTSPLDIALTVLGVPPGHIVIPWNEATSGGLALTGLLSEPARRDLESKVKAAWPPGPYALAAAAAKVVATIAGRSRQSATCFVAPDDSQGLRARTAAWPVRFNSEGIVEVDNPTLSSVERVALDNATLL